MVGIYNPHFSPLINIQASSIIGSEPDYTSLYNILELDIFEFYINGYHILKNNIFEIFNCSYEELEIKARIEYNDEKFYSVIRLSGYTFIETDYDHLVYILNKLIIALKIEMFKFHPLHDEFKYCNELLFKMKDLNASQTYNDIIESEEAIRYKIMNLNSIIDTELSNIIMNKKIVDIENFIDEEKEFNEIEQYLEEAAKTLKLNLKAIRILDKKKSDKFVLPLNASDMDDLIKWELLINKPFNFLSYNDAMFSVNLNSHIKDTWDEDADMSKWHDLWNDMYRKFKNTTSKIDKKKHHISESRKRLVKARRKLEEQAEDLKIQFIKKSDKYKHPKLMKFMAARTTANINTIRDATSITQNRIDVLKNKYLYKNPAKFFKRAVRLYLGKTGNDIIYDLQELRFNSKNDYVLAIKYLYFLMDVIENRKDMFKSPVLPILNADEFAVGFEKPDILKILTGHMFIHTVTLSKNISSPTQLVPNVNYV